LLRAWLATVAPWRYTPAMREFVVASLVLLFLPAATAQTVPAGWKTIKDSKGLCRIAVPEDWTALGATSGAAVWKDSMVAIAAVTSQHGQEFKPLTEALIRSMEIAKDKLFENSAKRIFYQDRTSTGPEDPNAYSASVPGPKGSTCSCHIRFVPGLPSDTAKKIALTLGSAGEETPDAALNP
jgi:hypothetical protein